VLKAEAPHYLLNLYGPTEGTTVALSHEINLAELDSGSVAIGRPINNTEAFILDGQLRPVTQGEIGNIYIGGDCLACGYWKRPELNAEKFIMVDVSGSGQLRRLYNTGDLGWQRSDGAFMYAGRIDNQVKIRGYRIEIEGIESQLMESGFLQAVSVCAIRNEETESYLVAFIMPLHPASFNSTEMTYWLKENLPEYMVPCLIIVSEIPLNLNGKVDRPKLLTQLSEQQNLAKQSLHLCGDEHTLLLIWQRILDYLEISLDDNFFNLGGNSLQAAKLVVEIGCKFDQRFSVTTLYDAPTPRQLAQIIKKKTLGNDSQHDIQTTLLKDSYLPTDIQPLPREPEQWLTHSAGRVFLTGVTGFLGAFFLRDLLQQPGVRQVICLVRAPDNAVALQRIEDNLAKYGIWQAQFSQRLQALAGDLSQPQLALDMVTYQHLATKSDVIFHLGAHVNYIQPYSVHWAANISGTLNILRLAVERKPKPLHYVSTIAAFGPAGLLSPVNRIYEDDELMSYLEGMKYDTGYSQSQWVAEQLIWRARARGVPWAVYRPGFIMGDSISGVRNPKDFVARLIKGCIAIGAYPLLPGQRKEFVPVNYVSAALLSIASNNSWLGQAYHLLPPNDIQSTDLNSFFELLNQCGYQLRPLTYSQWIARLNADPELDSNPLMPLLPMLSETVYGQLTRWEVYERMPTYDALHTQLALAETHGPSFVPMSSTLLGRYLTYWRNIGFLQALD
jgi:thioester reductase-like protein